MFTWYRDMRSEVLATTDTLGTDVSTPGPEFSFGPAPEGLDGAYIVWDHSDDLTYAVEVTNGQISDIQDWM